MAIKYYAGSKLTGVSGDTKPTTLPTGSTFLETNTDDLYCWDGDSWNVVAGNTVVQTLSNKTFSDHITITEISAPSTPSSGYGAIYIKSDNKLYFKNDGGTEYDVTLGAAGGEANESSFKTIVISGQDNVVADTTTDTLTLVAGSGMTITTTAGTDTVTFVSSATGTLDGLTDTTITSPADASLLLYDTGTSTWRDAAMSGDATISDTGALTVSATAIEGTMLNSNTVDDSSIELASNTLNVKAVGVTNAMLAGSIANAKLVNSSIIVSDGSNTSPVSLGGTLTFTATANETTVAESAGTITIGLPNNVTIAGNLIVTGNHTVNGTTITVNSTIMTVVDPIIHLQTASGGGALSSDTNKDVGLAMQYYSGSAKTAFLGFDDSAAKLTFIPDATLSSEVVSGSVGTIVANLEGSATQVIVANNNNTDTTTYIPLFLAIGDGTAQAIYTDTHLTFNTNLNQLTLTSGMLRVDGILIADVASSAGSGPALISQNTDDDLILSANGTGEIILDGKVTATQLDILAQGDLRLQDASGGQYVAVEAGATSATYTITLPVAAPGATGKVLKSSGSDPWNILVWADDADSGAANQNAFSNVAVSGQTTVAADTATDTLTLIAGTNVTITTDAGSADSVTISAAASGASESFAIAMAVAL